MAARIVGQAAGKVSRGIWSQAFSIQHPAFSIQQQEAQSIGRQRECYVKFYEYGSCWMLDAECWMLLPMDQRPPMPFPPPVLALLLMLIARLLGVGAPKMNGSAWRSLGYLFVSAGVALGFSGFSWFKLKRTPVRPGTRPTLLVTDGVFQFTRNPMYLGMVLFLIGWAFLRRTPIAFVAGPLFYVIIDRWQIPFEESLLTEHFGNEFQEYCSKVRRWL